MREPKDDSDNRSGDKKKDEEEIMKLIDTLA